MRLKKIDAPIVRGILGISNREQLKQYVNRGMYGGAYAITVAYMIEAALIYIYAQRVYPLAFSRIRLVAALAISGGVLWVTQVHWQSWRLPILGLTLVSSLALIVLMGRDEFASLLSPLLRKRLGTAADGRDGESFASGSGQPAPRAAE
jgi:hypothetical protein